ncbi:hypothetical protein [Bacillus sp. AFS053548]|nr:hypothetical protein [Bacillus sp. AFS053548]
MSDKKQKSPFLTNKPTGTLPKRSKENSLLLNLNRKIKDEIDKFKKNN